MTADGPSALQAEVAVIGAGVVGLAVAVALSPRHHVVVLERHDSYGRETTSHNSGVVHSGLYYPTGSLKHRLCLAARDPREVQRLR